MAENNIISAEEFENYVLADQEEFETIELDGLTLRVRRYLDLTRMIAFTDYVVNACFDRDTGEYLPEMKEFAIRSAIIIFYTNIVLPNDPEAQCRILYNTSIPSQIMASHIIDDGGQLNGILSAIDAKLNLIASTNADELRRKFEEAANSLAEIGEQLSDIFGGINEEDIAGVINALSATGLDEEKLVSAFINQSQNNTGSAQDISIGND